MVAERHRAGDVAARPDARPSQDPPPLPSSAAAAAQAVPAHSLPDEDDREGGRTALARPQQLVGRYRLLMPLAEGGMAQVWAAKPEKGGLSRTVVLKLVLPKFAADEHYA